MDYTDLKTYKIQAKYIIEIYNMKRKEVSYKMKIAELNKLKETYQNVLDDEDNDDIIKDIEELEKQIKSDRKRVKKYAELIEHIETLCNVEGMENTEYLETPPKTSRYWIDKSYEEIEQRYQHLINPN